MGGGGGGRFAGDNIGVDDIEDGKSTGDAGASVAYFGESLY